MLWGLAQAVREHSESSLQSLGQLFETHWAGKQLLDDDGAAEVVAAKRASTEAVSTDAEIIDMMESATGEFQESALRLREAMLNPLVPGIEAVNLGRIAEAHEQRAQLYRKLCEALSELPDVPHVEPSEEAAASLLHLQALAYRPGESLRRLVTSSSSDSGSRVVKSGPCTCCDDDDDPKIGKNEQANPHAERKRRTANTPGSQQLEELVKELFQLHDLNRNGLLEEVELTKLNEKIALLHHGKNIDRSAVKEKYRVLFREKLNPQGQPVPFETFRTYILQVLGEFDPHEEPQIMILEQFIAEAHNARATLRRRMRTPRGSRERTGDQQGDGTADLAECGSFALSTTDGSTDAASTGGGDQKHSP